VRVYLYACGLSLSLTRTKLLLKLATFFAKGREKNTFGGAFYSFFWKTGRRFVTPKTNAPLPGRRLKTSKSEEEKRKNLI